MSGSETGGGGLVVSGGELQQQSPVAVVQSPLPPPAALQNMHLSLNLDGIAVYKSPNDEHRYNNNGAASGGGGGSGEGSAACGNVLPAAPHGINVNMGIGSAEESVKRKRGRPRKYGPDGTMATGLAAHSLSFAKSSGGGGGARPLSLSSGASSVSPTSIKKAKGRPPGSTKKQQIEALGSACVGFMPHVIIVKSGEDVCSKIMSFSELGSRVVCILTANGAISNVTLRQPATSGGTVTYEGRFEILSLSGSFMLYEDGDQRTRTGVLSVSLSGPDGRVLGGSVAGLLTAASPVQVVLGSFIADGHKESKSANQKGHLSPAVRLPAFSRPIGADSPPLCGILSEYSGGSGSPPNQNTGVCINSNTQGTSGMPWK